MQLIRPEVILTEARRLLIEKGWTQGEFARNKDGIGRATSDPDVSCFCILGALKRASATYVPIYETADRDLFAVRDKAYKRAHYAVGAVVNDSIPYFNDHVAKSVDDVIEVLDKAITLAKGMPDVGLAE